MASLAATMAGRESDKWDECVKQIQSAMNATHNKGIRATPAEALIGCNARTTAEAQILQEVQTEVQRLHLAELRKQISDHITEDQRRQKERYDKARREATQYQGGELVMVEITTERTTGESRKLRPKFKGPSRVHRVLENDRYQVEDLQQGGRMAKMVSAVERLKFWIAAIE